MRRIVTLVVLIILAGGVWLFRDRIRTAWDEMRGREVVPEVASEELAVQAETKLHALRDGSAPSASLSAVELESLLVYRYQGVLPAFIDSPRVEIDGDRLRLRVRVPVDKLPSVDGFAEAAAFLPDTTDLAVTGKLLPLDSGRVAFGVDEVSAARFPLPDRLIPGALTRLGRREQPGLPNDAIALPLPQGAGGAYIRRDSLVLLARGSRRD
ncbi:MAG TPA: hypothetical protein VFZ69_16240 [Longimicrobiales bacterium]